MEGDFGHLTLPALARESGPLHGPFPLASFGISEIHGIMTSNE